MSFYSILFLTFLICQRLSELVIANRNTAHLLKRGAYEVGASHYPTMVALHSAWVACLVIFGFSQEIALGWLAVFVILQGFRLWILLSLGGRWTTRIIVIDEPLVASGPFKFLKHPNYALVIAEIFVAPMVLGLFWVGLLFSILNACMLFVRISAENQALGHLR
jgi:methyltransferase